MSSQSLSRVRAKVDVPDILKRIATLALITAMLTVQASAAPVAMMDIGKKAGADLQFWYSAAGWAEWISAFVAGRSRMPAARQQETQSERDAQVTNVTIYPDTATIKRGEREFFGAIAYDSAGVAVGGVKITWQAHDDSRNRQIKMLQTGEFNGIAPGVYTLTASAGGHSSTATVTVLNENRPNSTTVPTSVIEVSSRDVPSTIGSLPSKKGGDRFSRVEGALSTRLRRASFTRTSAPYASAAAPAVRVLPFLDDEPGFGWDQDDYLFADDPDNDRGRPPGRPVDQGVGSGNFDITAPVLSLPGRGLDLSLNLVYNSRLWSKAGSEITYDMDRDWPAPGWSLGFGRIVGLGTGGAMLIDADGTRHGFSGSVTVFPGGFITFIGRTTDGTFIDYSSSTDSTGTVVSAEAKLPNGTVIQYGMSGRAAVYPTRITDADGNYISVQYKTINNVQSGPKIEFITDTLGRTINFHYGNGKLTAITTPGLGGGTRTLARLHYKTLNLNYGFSGLTPRVINPSPTVLDAIFYPGTSTGYWFGDTDSYSSYGMLAKYSEQRGMGFSAQSLGEQGTVTAGSVTSQCLYNYPMTPNFTLTDAPTYTTKTETWEGMDTAAALTQYSVQKTSTTRTTTITHPDLTKSVQLSFNYSSLPQSNPDKFKDGLIYQDETYDSNDVLLSKSKVETWAKGDYDSPRPVRVEATDERNQTTAAVFDYGPRNQVTDIRDYNYGGTTLLRRTHMAYKNNAEYINRHIFNLVRRVDVYASDDTTRVSRVEYEYDETPRGNTPGVVQHDIRFDPFQEPECEFQPDPSDPDYFNPNCDPFTEPRCDGIIDQILVCSEGHDPATDFRGNVTSVKRYVNAAALTGEIVHTQAYDITGNVITVSTSCCEQTSAVFLINNQYAYALSQTRGAADPESPHRVTVSATYDFNTGLIRSSTDSNFRTTQMDYFADTWRPQMITSSTSAYKTFLYDDAAMKITETDYISGSVVASRNIKLLNGQGQIRREEDLGQDDVWDVVETRYDLLSRMWKQTRPFNAGTPLLSETTYDALGRVKTVTSHDGSHSTAFYNEVDRPSSASSTPGQTVRTVDAWGRERWARKDADGRLVEVVEPNPDGNGSVTATGNLVTSYSYDTLGNLIGVLQGGQQRAFKYDSLSRLTHQKLAEEIDTLNDSGQYVGAATGTWSDTFTYDQRSNLITQTDARGVKTVYSYNSDPLNRLQSLSYDTSGFGDTSHPILAAPGVTYEYVTAGDKMRLFKVTTAGVSTEEFGYDTEGRLSSSTLTLTSRPTFPMVTDYVSDSLDRVKDVTYPAEYGMTSAPRKLVHHDYDVSSRVSGLKVDGADYASQIMYNASSQMTSLKVGATGANQVTENYSFDELTGLVTNQKVQRGASTLLDLDYDYLRPNTTSGRTGQLTKILNNLNHNRDRGYQYDALGRLKTATGGQSANWSQNYAYDRYGNRTSVSATGTTEGTTLAAPTNLIIVASAGNGISLSWTGSSGAHHYQIERRSNISQSYQAIDTTSQTSYTDNTVTSGAAYVYRVRAADAANNLSASSNVRLATAIAVTDPMLESGVTIVKAAHVTELRQAVNAVRTFANLPPSSWTDTTLQGVTIQAVHVTQVRDSLTPALQAIGLPIVTFTDTQLSGVTVKQLHIEELRTGITRSGPSDGAAGGSPVPRDGLASVSYDQTTNRINTAGWEYDATGNLTRAMRTDGTWQKYVYDAASRLVKVQNDATGITQVIHTYGASNHRLIEQVGTESSNQRTYYVWSGDSVIAEYEETPAAPASPKWTKSYVYLGSRLLATLEPNGPATEKVQYHHPDRLGTRLVTNASDTTVIEQVTLPFGTALDAESTGATKRRFTSYERSGVTGLDYAVNRSYDPLQGRFTQADPIGMAASSLIDPQSLNMYAYCANDPVNRVDPTGLLFGWLKNLFKRIVRALIQAVIVAVYTLITTWSFHAAIGAGVAAFVGAFIRPLGWQPSLGRTPPTFGNSGPTLGQIFSQTPIGRKLTPDPRLFRTPGINGNSFQATGWCPPTREQLRNDPVVIQALHQAWRDSRPGAAFGVRKEQVGWVYALRGRTIIRRGKAGTSVGVDPRNPPQVRGAILLAFFHTHPGFASQKMDPIASKADIKFALQAGVPGLLISEGMIITYFGPNRRGANPDVALPPSNPAIAGYPGNSANSLGCP